MDELEILVKRLRNYELLEQMITAVANVGVTITLDQAACVLDELGSAEWLEVANAHHYRPGGGWS